MDMEMKKAAASTFLELRLSLSGPDQLIRDMFPRFSSVGVHSKWLGFSLSESQLFGLLSKAETSGAFDAKTCHDLWGFFSKNRESNSPGCYKDFETLMRSHDFMLLCYWLDLEHFAAPATISLRSADEVVLKTDKSAATAESSLLNDVVGETLPDGEAIPVCNVSSAILSKVTHFWERKHYFFKELESITSRYKLWINDFINSNKAILTDLHEAADYLDIPSLLDLTTNMVGKTVEEISECYGNKSLSQMLSSLGFDVSTGVAEDGHHAGGTA